MIGYLALGVALGIASSLPPGPCGLAIMSTVSHGGTARRALATAAGGAVGDLVYSTLGLVGIGSLIARAAVALQATSGAVMIAFGGAKLLERPPARPPADHPSQGFALGLGLVLANPAALVTWVVVVGAHLAGAPIAARACTVAGITLGSFVWFATVGRLARAGRPDRLLRLSAALGAVLVGVGVISLARAAEALFSS